MENVFILILCDEKLKVSYEVIGYVKLFLAYRYSADLFLLSGPQNVTVVVSESMPSFRAKTKTTFIQIL